MESKNDSPYQNKTLMGCRSTYCYCSPFKIDDINQEKINPIKENFQLSPNLIVNKSNSSTIKDIRSENYFPEHNSL